MSKLFRKLPLVTFCCMLLAIMLHYVPSLHDVLVYDRTAIRAGEVWRVLTGHLLHWNGNHLLWDVLMFGVLGALIEQRSRTALCATLITTATVSSAWLLSVQPDVQQYRGLSGIDSALFVLAALMLLGDARRDNRSLLTWLIVPGLIGFAGKIGFELSTGSTLFVDDLSAGLDSAAGYNSAASFRPLPGVHVIGALIGLANFVAWSFMASRPASLRKEGF